VGYRRHSLAIGLPGGQLLEEFEIEHRLDRFQSAFLVITNNHSDGCTAWRATFRAGRQVYQFACNFCGSLKPQVALHSPASLSMSLNNF
jgi:hypothetical protein